MRRSACSSTSNVNTRYIVRNGFFKTGEIADLCGRHQQQDNELATRELAERVMCGVPLIRRIRPVLLFRFAIANCRQFALLIKLGDILTSCAI
jgi:hypothetical protein